MITEMFTANQLKKESPVFGQLSFDDHEQIVFCHDKDTGLKAIIGVHNTILGPALGGTRMYNYATEWDALNDVLRLSRGMTYKAAITGLNLGGGKAVIIGEPSKIKTPELMKRFGKFVHTLGGTYYTAEDVGMETSDMDTIREVTPYVTGISEANGGAGNPSPVTAYGVYMGMKAATKFAFGNNDLKGKRILIEGIGHVGEELVRLTSKEGADVVISDINQERLEKVAKAYGATIYRGNNLYAEAADIYAPCALGATINDKTIDDLKIKVIAGAANNQLSNEEIHGAKLQNKGIVYAPDFLINAGGIINVFAEIEGYNRDHIISKTENIYDTTLDILNKAKATNMTTNASALSIAEDRIAFRKKEVFR
ncbi:Glu/Leu/Phe/Val dehydrogenase dimerization domain-containing protein [Aquimarina pacifica]|uniref:Glu/Leu/Phe/Val dehydrogenase dimerization domain-containing protein n=1 Tax=Aquimarina pacifica TaxID=1296415 RepID=UPI00047128CB|nr:Glu/Leu/Phe/Val dehydrogenase dimerization domain-containing protein [Aquimarina pacifica]